MINTSQSQTSNKTNMQSMSTRMSAPVINQTKNLLLLLVK